MKERDDTVYLKHILDAIARIEGYLSGVNQETFTKTPLLQDGVIRQTEILYSLSFGISTFLSHCYLLRRFVSAIAAVTVVFVLQKIPYI